MKLIQIARDNFYSIRGTKKNISQMKTVFYFVVFFASLLTLLLSGKKNDTNTTDNNAEKVTVNVTAQTCANSMK